MNIKLLHLAAITAAYFPATTLAADPSDACQGAKVLGVQCGAGTNTGGLETRIGMLIDVLFYVAGAVAVIFIIVGAIRYITSTGDAKRIQQAKDTVFYAVAGLIVAILARAIVGFIIGRLA